ncbi:MAG TPA: ABC transporter substrate-binding protein, partial [Terriglobales bacterium]|nr:ABC transporter substrate-binding protein [Terriglobales bacterium]
MKLIVLALLAVSSLAVAATRPHYGGTMHVAAGISPSSLDPIALAQAESTMGDNLSALLFDTLVRMNDRGSVEPALATSWQPEPGNQRWRFSLLKGVSFSDGTPLTSDVVAASLRASNSAWKVFPAGDAVVIESDTPVFNLPAQLTLSRYAIAKRAASRVLGSGPYVVSQWDPGKRLVLAARDDYWQGRPFVDTMEIDLGKNLRDQMIALDVGKAELIEVAP